MKKRKLVFVLVILIFAFFFFGKNEEEKDNYYKSVNSVVLEKNKLEEGEYSWSNFTEAQEMTDEDTSIIVEDILAGDVDSLNDNEIKVIKSIYDKAKDKDKRNNDGIKALEPYLDKVWNITTVEELIDVIVTVEQELGIDILTNIEIVQDYKNNDKNIVYFYPVTFAFGATGDYIVDEDYMTYKAYIRRACVQLWKVYGYEAKEAREVVNRVFSFYENVSNHSKLSDELEDISSYYQVVSEDEVTGLLSNAGKEYLSRKGIGNREFYSIVDKEQYKYLNDSLNVSNIDLWKEVIVTKILASYASYGTEEYVKIVEDLNESLLGSSEEKTEEEQSINMVKSLFTNEIDSVYEQQFLTDDKRTEIETMFLDIKTVFKKRLENNDWLSEEAKEKALVKLDKMDIIIGTTEDVVSYEMADNLEASNDSLISDVIKIQKLAIKKDLERLDSGEKINLVQQTVVNAYYQPLDNSIIVPVAFFELIDEESSYYEKLGTLGMVLAHEITHGFDSNGSGFDENGNLNNWWSEEDKKAFDKLKQDVIDYYGKYEVLDGKYIDGEKTVNENIADLGALACITDVASDKGANDEEYRSMFSSFAEIWASHESEEYMELLLLQDVHAPNQFRVNAVLSSVEEFYQVYDIYPWNDMWISKNDRVEVW